MAAVFDLNDDDQSDEESQRKKKKNLKKKQKKRKEYLKNQKTRPTAVQKLESRLETKFEKPHINRRRKVRKVK